MSSKGERLHVLRELPSQLSRGSSRDSLSPGPGLSSWCLETGSLRLLPAETAPNKHNKPSKALLLSNVSTFMNI